MSLALDHILALSYAQPPPFEYCIQLSLTTLKNNIAIISYAERPYCPLGSLLYALLLYISFGYLASSITSLGLRRLVMCEVFTISLCYTFIVRYEQYSSTTHNIPAVSTLYYCIHNSVYPKWVYRVKNLLRKKL